MDIWRAIVQYQLKRGWTSTLCEDDQGLVQFDFCVSKGEVLLPDNSLSKLLFFKYLIIIAFIIVLAFCLLFVHPRWQSAAITSANSP